MKNWLRKMAEREFYLPVLTSLCSVLAAAQGVLPPTWAAGVSAVCAVGTALSRGLAKGGKG